MRNVVFQNLSITLLSKIISLASFVYIAKTLSEDSYGLLVYIAMVVSLLPLLQFGSIHGLSILLPKYHEDKHKNEKQLFIYTNYISYSLQLVAAVFLTYLLDEKINRLFIAVIAVDFFLTLYVGNVQIYLNSKHAFYKANLISAIEKILKPILVLFGFYFLNTIESIFFGQLLATILVFFLTSYLQPFFWQKFSFQDFKSTVLGIYSIGFFIYIIWALDIVFRTSDRWFISQFYDLSELATYGFTSSLALNIWLVAMSFFAPYSQILYTEVAKKNFIEVQNLVESTNKKIYILMVFICCIAAILYPYLLKWIIKKYDGTYHLFLSLVAVSVFLSVNNMYIYYMISNNMHFKLIKYQFFILMLNFLLNTALVMLHVDIVFYSYSTVLSLAIYFFLVKNAFNVHIKRVINESTA